MVELGLEIEYCQSCSSLGKGSSWSGKDSRVRFIYRFLVKQLADRLTSITKKVVAQRFGPKKKVQRDMLGSFIAHGLNQKEAEAETILQM